MTEEQRSFALNEKNYNWYVLYTLPRWEKKVAKLLDEKGYTFYCPLNKVERQWSDRRKIIEQPLFKGYVFVMLHEQNKWDVKVLPGVLNFVYWLGKPAKVKQQEIDIIKKFMQEFDEVLVTNTSLAPADTVVIKQGLLMNYKGLILEVSGSNARVLINSLGIQLSAVFKKENLSLLEKADPS